MLNRSKRAGVAALAAAALTVTTMSAPAMANEEPPSSTFTVTQDELNEVDAFFRDYGVSDVDRAALLDKVSRSEPLDSLLLSEDEAVSVEVVDHPTTVETISRYPDGSVAVTTMDKPATSTGGIGPRAVTGCATSGTPGVQTACKVHYNSGIISFYFFANYTLAYDAYDSIQRVYGNSIQRAIGHDAEIVRFGIVRSREAGTGKPAVGEFQILLKQMAGPVIVNSYTRTLALRVGANKATQALY